MRARDASALFYNMPYGRLFHILLVREGRGEVSEYWSLNLYCIKFQLPLSSAEKLAKIKIAKSKDLHMTALKHK